MSRSEWVLRIVLSIVLLLMLGTPIFALGSLWVDIVALGAVGAMSIYQLLGPMGYPVIDPTGGHGILFTTIFAFIVYPSGSIFLGYLALANGYYFSGRLGIPESWSDFIGNPTFVTVACIEAIAGIMFASTLAITLPTRVAMYEMIRGEAGEVKYLAMKSTRYLRPLLVTVIGLVLAIPAWMHVDFASLPDSARNIISGLMVVGIILFLGGLILTMTEWDDKFRGF